MIAKLINLVLFFLVVHVALRASIAWMQALFITAALFIADNYWGDAHKK